MIDAVVNISTSQKVEARNNQTQQPPQLPNDPQLDELFRDFFNRRGQGGGNGGGNQQGGNQQRRGGSIRSAPASSSTPKASWSPTTT